MFGHSREHQWSAMLAFHHGKYTAPYNDHALSGPYQCWQCDDSRLHAQGSQYLGIPVIMVCHVDLPW